jgi:hypothetical protein
MSFSGTKRVRPVGGEGRVVGQGQGQERKQRRTRNRRGRHARAHGGTSARQSYGD